MTGTTIALVSGFVVVLLVVFVIWEMRRNDQRIRTELERRDAAFAAYRETVNATLDSSRGVLLRLVDEINSISNESRRETLGACERQLREAFLMGTRLLRGGFSKDSTFIDTLDLTQRVLEILESTVSLYAKIFFGWPLRSATRSEEEIVLARFRRLKDEAIDLETTSRWTVTLLEAISALEVAMDKVSLDGTQGKDAEALLNGYLHAIDATLQTTIETAALWRSIQHPPLTSHGAEPVDSSAPP